MPRSNAIVVATIPANFQRLRRHGYCASIFMADVWQMVVPADQDTIDGNLNGSSGNDLPIVYISRVADNVPSV